MAHFETETVLHTHHWNDTMFSFTTTRSPSFRFQNGNFITLGLVADGRPLMRAYSVVSANHEAHLEFLSIKVPDGPLTSRLQNLKVGDTVLMTRKAAGSLVISDLRPGRRLYLFCTGTGIAPFMSVIRDPETYERFERVILVHGVRYVTELAYNNLISEQLTNDEYIGDLVRRSLVYYPTVTREQFVHRGRVTELITSGTLAFALNLPRLDPAIDRAMICGSPHMMRDTCTLLEREGFEISPGVGQLGDFVIERAFAEK
jgi:ferredoxin--NADP+ reductase